MGVVKGITYDKFPAQSNHLHERVEVCFNYDLEHTLRGTVVRDDTEAPGVMIIKLDDGRHVLSSECMWSPRGKDF
jgi:hypothetical protein